VRQAGLRLYPGYVGAKAPTLVVTVQDRSGALIARGSAKDYVSNEPVVVPVELGRPHGDTRICVRNAGSDGVSLAHAELPQQGRRRLPIRIDVTTRPEPAIERLPVALTRASFFKSEIVTRPLIAVFLALVLGLVAAAVVLVLRGRPGGDADA
jgi:hypothetical protein